MSRPTLKIEGKLKFGNPGQINALKTFLKESKEWEQEDEFEVNLSASFFGTAHQTVNVRAKSAEEAKEIAREMVDWEFEPDDFEVEVDSVKRVDD